MISPHTSLSHSEGVVHILDDESMKSILRALTMSLQVFFDALRWILRINATSQECTEREMLTMFNLFLRPKLN